MQIFLTQRYLENKNITNKLALSKLILRHK